MSVIVQKYGGTSVAGPEEIKRVARRVVETAAGGQPGLRRRLGDGRHDRPARRARAPGLGRPASARAGHAADRRRADLGRARLDGDQRPRPRAPSRSPARRPGSSPTRATARRASSRCAAAACTRRSRPGQIAIVAGFQGVSTDKDVTTLGRGGSDTTAVALAAALDADVCEIYTDVDGVFTADPRIVPSAPQAAGRSRTRRCSSCRRPARAC